MSLPLTSSAWTMITMMLKVVYHLILISHWVQTAIGGMETTYQRLIPASFHLLQLLHSSHVQFSQSGRHCLIIMLLALITYIRILMVAKRLWRSYVWMMMMMMWVITKRLADRNHLQLAVSED